MFTFNTQTCQYDIVQNCLLSSKWKAQRVRTLVKKEVYPSDVERLCEDLLKESGCEPGVSREKECFVPNETCYTSCEVKDKKELQQSSSIVLYDISLTLHSLYCSPSKNVTVEVL